MPSLEHARGVLTRRRFLTAGAAVAAGTALYSGEIERHMLLTVRQTLRIPNLPAPFHGFRIAQLSDIHFRVYDEPFFVHHAVHRINELKPDLVALTGDFITTLSSPSPDRTYRDANGCAEILRDIQCPLRFCSMGNHDANAQSTVIGALTRNRLPVLRNQFTSIELRGSRMWIAGLADAYCDVPNLNEALPQRREGEPVILLGHEPDFADTVVTQSKGVDLMLAGHTHGGQIRVPFCPPIFLPAMGEKYAEGLFRVGENAMYLYVNRGLGCMHLPFRLNCPPELTLLTLEPA